jgi:DNA polymerase III epsilon subunit-like protein
MTLVVVLLSETATSPAIAEWGKLDDWGEIHGDTAGSNGYICTEKSGRVIRSEKPIGGDECRIAMAAPSDTSTLPKRTPQKSEEEKAKRARGSEPSPEEIKAQFDAIRSEPQVAPPEAAPPTIAPPVAPLPIPNNTPQDTAPSNVVLESESVVWGLVGFILAGLGFMALAVLGFIAIKRSRETRHSEPAFAPPLASPSAAPRARKTTNETRRAAPEPLLPTADAISVMEEPLEMGSAKRPLQLTPDKKEKHTGGDPVYLFFAIETTGFGTTNARIVQVGWVVTDELGRTVSENEYIIRPEGYTIPGGAARVHGITTEHAKANGVNPIVALGNLAKDCQSVRYVVAHNATYELMVLRREMQEAGIEDPFLDKTALCTMQISTEYCALPKSDGGWGYRPPKLNELYTHLFGGSFENSHNALTNARACKQCFGQLLRFGVVNASTADGANASDSPSGN